MCLQKIKSMLEAQYFYSVEPCDQFAYAVSEIVRDPVIGRFIANSPYSSSLEVNIDEDKKEYWRRDGCGMLLATDPYAVPRMSNPKNKKSLVQERYLEKPPDDLSEADFKPFFSSDLTEKDCLYIRQKLQESCSRYFTPSSESTISKIFKKNSVKKLGFVLVYSITEGELKQLPHGFELKKHELESNKNHRTLMPPNNHQKYSSLYRFPERNQTDMWVICPEITHLPWKFCGFFFQAVAELPDKTSDSDDDLYQLAQVLYDNIGHFYGQEQRAVLAVVDELCDNAYTKHSQSLLQVAKWLDFLETLGFTTH